MVSAGVVGVEGAESPRMMRLEAVPRLVPAKESELSAPSAPLRVKVPLTFVSQVGKFSVIAPEPDGFEMMVVGPAPMVSVPKVSAEPAALPS